MENLEELVKQVLDLPLDQRAELTERLLASLDELTPAELEQVWAAEAERRYRGFKNGKIDAYDGPEVHRQVVSEIK